MDMTTSVWRANRVTDNASALGLPQPTMVSVQVHDDMPLINVLMANGQDVSRWANWLKVTMHHQDNGRTIHFWADRNDTTCRLHVFSVYRRVVPQGGSHATAANHVR